MNRRLFTAFLLILISSVMSAQDIWTLDRCINYAFENNISIKKKALDIEMQENSLLKSQLDFVPAFNASINHNLNWGRSVDLQNLEIIHNQFSQSTSASLSTSIYLLDGLSKLNTLRSNRTALEISMNNVESLKDEISISIAKSYLEILLSQELVSTTKENFKSISDQVSRTEILVNEGSQSYSSLLEIQAQLATERVQLISAENGLTNNLLALQQLLDLPFDKNFTIAVLNADTENIDYRQENIDSIYSMALSLPKIKGAELALKQSDYELKIAKGKYYPRISFSAAYGTFYSSTSEALNGEHYPFIEQIKDNINPTIGLGLSIPIFNNWMVKTNVKNAKLKKRNIELDIQTKHNDLYKEVQNAVIQADTYYNQMLAQKMNLKSIKESFRYTEEKFNIGLLDATAYTVAKTNLFKAQSEFLKAKYQFIFQLKIIDYYKGIPLSL